MRAGLVAALVAGLLAITGIAYALFEATEPGISSALAFDSGCRGRSLSYGGDPPEAMPIHNVTIDARMGEAFSVHFPRGEWMALLVGEDVEFAEGPRMVAASVHWQDKLLFGWCRGVSYDQVYFADGNDLIQLSYWDAKDTRLHIS